VVVDDDGASVADDTETGEGGPCTGDSGIGWPLCRKFKMFITYINCHHSH
jgi:hypothetical protein